MRRASPSQPSMKHPEDDLREQKPSLKRNPLESLSSFVNSFELRSVGTKISHSASSLGRSVSHKVASFPLFPSDEPSDNDNDENNSTLNDDDWLSSPSQKKRSNLSTHTLLDAECHGNIHNIDTYDTTSLLYQDAFASNEHLPNTPIATFSVPQDIIPRIDENEMGKIVMGEYEGQFDEILIVDCRFSYEFEGGHIKNAINISLHEDLEDHLLFVGPDAKRLVVFHCEFSLLRGPTLACHLRKLDRMHNSDRYPYLSYPDIVVLEGGYKKFFETYLSLCLPQAYVGMKDNNHRKSCEVEMNKVLLASKLTRAKSFNQFQPRRPLGCHSRSNSLTALLSTDQQLLSPTSSGSGTLRKKRSLKIKKRDRKDLRTQEVRSLFTQSLISLPSYDLQKSESPLSQHFDIEDLAPPTASFREHSKSLSNLLFSVNLSQLLLYSEALSPAFSLLDSLLELYLSFPDTPDFYEGPNNSGNLFQPSCSNVSPVKSMNVSPKRYSFPKLSPYVSQKLPLRLQTSRPSIYPHAKLTISSPPVSLPLTNSSSFDTLSRFSEYCDSINETPVECSINLKGFRRPMTSDLNEVREESGF